MAENNNLKKKATDLINELRAFLNTWIEKIRSRFMKGENLTLNFRHGVIFVMATLMFGFFVGYIATKHKTDKLGGGFSFSQVLFPKKMVFPGAQKDGSFIFSNFEKPTDLAAWELLSAGLETSTNYAWEGIQSGKITFFAGKELSAITIDNLGKTKGQLSNWSNYGSLQFYLFQPGVKDEHLTLMITDLWGKRYEETLTVPHNRWEKFTIPIKKIGVAINVKKISQVSISRREKGAVLDFYIDDVRLLSPNAVGGGLKKENILDYEFALRKPAWLIMDPSVKGAVVHIPFVVKNETNAFCHLCAAEGGVPFPLGELKDLKNIKMRNAYGEDIPYQAKVLAFWPDQSIKWITLSFLATLPPGGGAGYFLDYGPNLQSLDFASPLKVMEDKDSIKVNTGTLEAVLSKKSFYLFDEVFIDQNANGIFEPNESITSHAELILGFRGKEFRTDLDSKTYKLEVEEKGSQRAVIRASGWFQSEDGARYCQAIVRYYFYQGKSSVRVSHTLIYTGYPENKQYAAYKMLKLPDNETVDFYAIKMPYQFSEAKDEQVYAGLGQAMPPPIVLGNTLKFFQNDYDSATTEHDGNSAPMQDPYTGWMDVSSQTKGIAVAVRHFRENFPKAFKLDRTTNILQIDLWPKESGPIDLQTTPNAVGPESYGRGNAFGLAKTHEILFYFHKGNTIDSDAANTAVGFLMPLIIRPNPYWTDATGALGRLYPVDPKYATEEKMLERLFDWADRQPRNFKWYGIFNFGDTLTWWRDENGASDEGGEEGEGEAQKYNEPGWHPVGRWGWYNCEGVGTHTGALIQFARSGQWKYFEFGENLAKHVMDIETVHYDTVVNDKRLKGILSEKYSQVGSMHRHNGDPWAGENDEASHTNVLGILLYYYLTGNERALDVVKEVGEYFLTEPFTYVGHPDIAPHRAMANALWGDVLLYQLTWDDRYKKAADKIIKIYLKGQQPDGSFLENYNPILKTWSGSKQELYMTGYLVGALMSYHELTQDDDVKDMLLKLVRYLVPSEFGGPAISHGIAYAYLITKDPFFIAAAEDNLKKLMDHQVFSADPLMDGTIYDKPIYHRPMTFLPTVPYVFGALEEHFAKEGKQ